MRPLLLALVLLVALPGPAAARTWAGKAVHVGDGDTIDVDVRGSISVSTFSGSALACAAWGDGSC